MNFGSSHPGCPLCSQSTNFAISFSISPYLPRPLLLKASLSHSLFPIAYSSPHPVIQQTQLMASWWTEPCHFSRSPLGSGLPWVWSTLQIQSIPSLHKQFNTAPLSYRFLTKQLKLERDADWVTNSANTIILTFHFFHNGKQELKTYNNSRLQRFLIKLQKSGSLVYFTKTLRWVKPMDT